MGMVGNDLGDAIMAAIGGDQSNADRIAAFHALGSAIVSYISGAAVITVTSVGGVTPGPGVSGPGIGHIS